MRWNPIEKNDAPTKLHPNLESYDEVYSHFSWNTARRELEGLPGNQGLNIAYECVDRHAQGALKKHIALRWLKKNNVVQDYTYGDLYAWSSRFANVLRNLGIQKGDRVFTLMGRIPELYFAVLGTLKNRSVLCPLFSAFGPEPIYSRLSLGDGRVLVTTETLYRRKVEKILPRLPKLDHVFLIHEDGKGPIKTTSFPYYSGRVQIHDLHTLLSDAAPEFAIEPTNPEDMALLHFTSGTTGKPKGAIHAHAAIVAHRITGKWALDLHSEDIFWCTADPGWVTGTSYGILSPLSNGVTSIIDESDFDSERWYHILEEQKITVWYTAPTAIRMLMKTGNDIPKKYDLSRLRFIASVGEPLNPEAVIWGKEVLGLPIHDNWWQTETGGIMVSNYPCMAIRPGSMGKPLPGIEAVIARRDSHGGVEIIHEPDTQGELALKEGWPSMFRGYLHEEERYRKCFSGGYYFTGDLAKRDKDGYLWFIGRADDVIKSSGHLIGPFEVESALMAHPAVAEAAVIGKPDPVAMEIVKAFVALNPGYSPSEKLRMELLGFARKDLGAAVAPKEIEFRSNLPKTRSGKIMRRLLKAQESGLPTGDTSTL